MKGMGTHFKSCRPPWELVPVMTTVSYQPRLGVSSVRGSGSQGGRRTGRVATHRVTAGQAGPASGSKPGTC